MKKSRIKNVIIHTVPITDEKKNEINYTFSKIYARYVSDLLNERNISNKQKADIIKSLIKE